ncbi:hypothetical protein BS17DRAFT_718718, partial [Gyrodon lividus]
LHESLEGMGATFEDHTFYSIILGSLPKSYHPLISSINAAAKFTTKMLTPHELISVLTEEYKHCQLLDH